MLRSIKIFILALTFTTARASEIDIPAFFASLKTMSNALLIAPYVMSNEYITPDMDANAKALAHELKWEWKTQTENNSDEILFHTALIVEYAQMHQLNPRAFHQHIAYKMQQATDESIELTKDIHLIGSIQSMILSQKTPANKSVCIKQHANRYMQAQKNINQKILGLMKTVHHQEKTRILELTKQVYSPVRIIPADKEDSML